MAQAQSKQQEMLSIGFSELRMSREDAEILEALLQEQYDVFEISRKYPEKIENNIRGFIFALQKFDIEDITKAFRTWITRGKRMPLPSQIRDIIIDGTYDEDLVKTNKDALPEWKQELEQHIGEAVVRAWFKDATKSGDTLHVKSPTAKRWIEEKYKGDLAKIGINHIQ